MFKKTYRVLLIVTLFLTLLAVSGCGGGGQVQRPSGLSPEAVVKNFFDSAKADKLNEAKLYVAPSSLNDPQVVSKYLAGQSGISDIKKATLLSTKKVIEQGNYAIVIANVQKEYNTTNFSLSPIGLEKINGEWYIVDTSKILTDAKYKLLFQLFSQLGM